jgi:hypothetical protein
LVYSLTAAAAAAAAAVCALFRLAITMPMSLANTKSLSKCRKLRELLLCTLPQQILDKGSFDQVRPPTAV